VKGKLASLIFESVDKLAEEICEIQVPSHRGNLKRFLSNEERDCIGTSTSMAPLSTKLHHDQIGRFRFRLEVLVLRTYRTSHMLETTGIAGA
jgi:hypothetical protein